MTLGEVRMWNWRCGIWMPGQGGTRNSPFQAIDRSNKLDLQTSPSFALRNNAVLSAYFHTDYCAILRMSMKYSIPYSLKYFCKKN